MIYIEYIIYITQKVEGYFPHLGKDPRVPVEEVFVQDRVVVGQRLGQTAEPGGRDFLEDGLEDHDQYDQDDLDDNDGHDDLDLSRSSWSSWL